MLVPGTCDNYVNSLSVPVTPVRYRKSGGPVTFLLDFLLHFQRGLSGTEPLPAYTVITTTSHFFHATLLRCMEDQNAS